MDNTDKYRQMWEKGIVSREDLVELISDDVFENEDIPVESEMSEIARTYEAVTGEEYHDDILA